MEPQRADDATPASQADAPAPEVPAPEVPAPEDVAAQEQEEILRAERRAWHQRTWLRALAVLAALAGLSAIIPYPLRITAECTIIPSQRAKVRSELPGVLSEILVDEGRSVKRGDVLARLDDR